MSERAENHEPEAPTEIRPRVTKVEAAIANTPDGHDLLPEVREKISEYFDAVETMKPSIFTELAHREAATFERLATGLAKVSSGHASPAETEQILLEHNEIDAKVASSERIYLTGKERSRFDRRPHQNETEADFRDREAIEKIVAKEAATVVLPEEDDPERERARLEQNKRAGEKRSEMLDEVVKRRVARKFGHILGELRYRADHPVEISKIAA